MEEEVASTSQAYNALRPTGAVSCVEHEGTTYYFCSQDCADSFRDSPGDYV